MRSAPPFIVGLTGGIGSGKSIVASRFACHGIAVVDTDAIAHALTAVDGAAIGAIRQAFGAGAIDVSGALDRSMMRSLVFSDEQARHRLESILHPLIRVESERQCRAATSPYVILAIPLLIESDHWRERCNRVCVVDCPEDLQVARVMARNQLDPEQIHAILAAQASRETRLNAADDVLDNSGSIDALHLQVDALHQHYIAAARA